MKSKLIFGLLATTLILAFASASFAQINVQIFSSPSAAESLNKRTAQTGDPTSSGAGVTVSGGVIANAELTTTTLTLSYGAPITSTCSSAANPGSTGCVQGPIPSGDPIRIVAATGLFANVTINTIKYSAGTIDIIIPECKAVAENGVTAAGGCSANTPSGSFRIVGVRNDVNGKTAPMTVTATLSNGGNNYIMTRSSDTTISALNAPFAALPAPTATATVFTNGSAVQNCTTTPATSCATVKLTEGYASAWRPSGQPGNASATGLLAGADQIIITVSGLPSGQTMSVTSSNSSTLQLIAAAGNTFTNPTSGTAVTSLAFNVNASSQTATEFATWTFTLGTTGTVSTAGSVTVTFAMGFQAASALDANGVPTAANGYPVYANANTAGPVTIENIVPSQTTLLIPFAVFGGGFDTGIALANTTADPFGTSTGGATAQSGTITLDFFPQLSTGGAGTPSTLTTSATIRPVTGLSADGTLAAGGEWTVLLSNLLPLATPPITGSFEGYIFVRTNFLDAHGVVYPTDFKSFTAANSMLVLSPPISSPRTGTEQLNN